MSFNEHIRLIGAFCHSTAECSGTLTQTKHSVFYFMRQSISSVVAVLVFAGTLFSQGHSSPVYPDVSVIQSDGSGITFEYRLTDLQYDTLSLDSREYTRLSFFGAKTPGRSDPANPDLKFRAITIAIPSGGVSGLEVLQKDYRTDRSARIAPLGDIRRNEDDEYYRTTEGLDVRSGTGGNLVEIYDVSNVRGIELATVHLHPLQIEDDGTALRVHNRIIVRVSFESGSFGTVDEYTYQTFHNVVLNIDRVPVVSQPRLRMEGMLAEPASHQNSVLADGPWYRFTIDTDGMYRIEASALQDAGIPVSEIDPQTIRIFSLGGRMLPEDISKSRPDDLVEIAIYVQGEENGSFNAGDYINFYGVGATSWEYDANERIYKHRHNYYSGENIYFLTYGGSQGKRMQSAPSLNESNPIRPNYFVSRKVHRNPRFNLLGSGKEWMGETFTAGTVTVFTNMLYGFTHTVNVPVVYRVQVAARAPTRTYFNIEDQNTNLGTIPVNGVNLGTIIGNYAARGQTTTFSRSGSLPENRSALRFEYQAGSQSEGFLEWFEIHYPRRFEAHDDYLKFTAPDTTGVVEFTVQGFTSSQITAYDVTDHANVSRITNIPGNGGASVRFQRPQQSGQPSRYTAVAPGGFLAVDDLQPMENSNVRGIATGAEFIIVSSPDLMSQAQRLKQHRESFTPNQLSTIVVDVKHIYNEFSGGLIDPTAIRDFLYHAYTSWEVTPRYVLLFGAGSFDYLSILAQRHEYIPTWQTQESFSQINTYTSDDFFVQFSPGSRRPSLITGRLNAINEDDARVMVDKIIDYETNADSGPWRNLISYVADDGLTTRGGDDGNIHTWQSEQLAQNFTPPAFERDKIYMIEYPAENTASGRRMPDVNRAIIDRFNQGALILNWTGHGNPRVWAYEWIFVKDTTIPQLRNRNRLTFVTAATCDFSRFDDPREQSGGELLVSSEQGGAIGLLSSSRIVWSSDNARFNNLYYTNLLTPLSNDTYPRVGDALFATKQTYHGVNDIKFVLLGDPTVRLHIPTHEATVATINDEPVVDTVELQALQKVTVDGTIRRPDGSSKDDFNGRMFVSVYDSDKTVSIQRWGGWSFTVPGNVIFRGESSVTQGRYSSTFVVPKDISHEGDAGRIALYFWGNGLDGRGFSRDIMLGGIDTTATPDTEGPDITLYLEDRNFRSGDLVSERPLLLVDLFDESGINISGGGVGHRIEAWLNDGQNIDLTDYYTGAIDSYQEGSIEYQMDELDPGPHHLRMRAWDVYNNSSTAEVFFDVASSERLTVQNVYNYPNPFQRETVFTFQHNQTVPIDVEVKVYTVAGRLIAQLREYSVTDRFVRIPWTGLDDDGDRLANGVYFYKVIARTVDGEFTSEVLGRLAVMR